VGTRLLLSSAIATMQQELLVCFLIALPLLLLSWLFTPLSSMPDALQDFSLISPARYMIDIARRVYLEGVGVDRLASDLSAGRDVCVHASDRCLGAPPPVGMKRCNKAAAVIDYYGIMDLIMPDKQFRRLGGPGTDEVRGKR
jgi:ABC-2 type transporter